MLSREERILAELMVSRGMTSRDAVERCARIKEMSPASISLADVLIENGGVERARVSPIAEEARALDQALEPALPGGGTLGEFRLIREIGRGGMGVVFEAVQESLGRRVALKILPAGAALDERLATRFLREARAAGRLQHPAIVPVFSSGHADGVLYFAMELIEGHSLADEVTRGPAAPERAARLIAQIAHAVEHAHQAGLIHRDIKPENILVGPDDRPRLTDFGLVHEFLANAFTLSLHVLGTPAYIPPEQALGEPVDPRSDVYSLGAVLYALLCGRPPYDAGAPFLVLSRVLEGGPPPLRTTRPDVPSDLAAICEHAMAREPNARYARAAEMADDLERFLRGEPVTVKAAPVLESRMTGDDQRVDPVDDLPRHEVAGLEKVREGDLKQGLLGSTARAADRDGLLSPGSTVRTTERAGPPLRPWGGPARAALAVGVLAVLAALLIAGMLTMRSPTGGDVSSSQSGATKSTGMPQRPVSGPVFRLVNTAPGQKFYPSLSPDGSDLVYFLRMGTHPGVYSQRLPDGPAVPLTTEVIFGPTSFSPDGRLLAVGSIGSDGSPCLTLLNLRDRSLRRLSILPGQMTWSPDGREIVLIPTGDPGFGAVTGGGGALPLASVDIATGQVRTLRTAVLSFPAYSPHGRRIAFASLSGGQIDLWTVARGGEDMVRATDDLEADWNPVWSRDGKHLYFGSEREGRRGLWSVEVNEDTGRPRGLPQRFSDTTFAGVFTLALSADGRTMAVIPRAEKARLIRLDLTADASPTVSSRPTVLPNFPPILTSPSVSPDGRMLAVTARSPEEDIAVLPSDGATEPNFLTEDAFQDGDPRWSPDGARIAFHSDRSGRMEIWTMRPDGSDLLQMTHTEAGGAMSPVWSPDGALVAYSVRDEGASMIRVRWDALRQGASLDSRPRPEPLAAPGAEEPSFVPWSWSPDGTTLAGSMKGIVLYEIGPKRYRRLTTSGEKPVWLPDGQRLLFTSGSKIYLLSARTGESRVVYSAEPNQLSSSFALTSDGRAIYADHSASGEEVWVATIGD